jgi:hypothetical protein
MTKFRKALKENQILQETLTLINFNVSWVVAEERSLDKSAEETKLIDFEISMFGLATKPKRTEPPAAPKGGATPIKAGPAAPQGGSAK